jgi:spore germination protein KC
MTGIAFDKGENGKIEITVQIVNPEAIKASEAGGGNVKKLFSNVGSTGETVFDAARNLTAKINKKVYFGQVQLMVISEEFARDGIIKIFDLFERDTEARRRADLIIAKGMEAKTVLKSESLMSRLPATHETEELESSGYSGKTLKVTLIDALKVLNKKEYSFVLPTIYNSTKSGIAFQEDLLTEGSAVIKKDKLVGFLDPLQTRGYLLSGDKIESTIINIPSPLNSKKTISIEIVRTKGKITSKIMNGKPVLSIEVSSEGNIGEQQEKEDLTKPDMIKTMEDAVQREMKDEIDNAVKITQKEYKSDIFGFIDEIYKNYYSDWVKSFHNWSNIYSQIPIKIEVNFKIRRSGLIRQPAESK